MSTLFSLINQAKNLGSYPLANAAFAVLADKALDSREKSLKFLWEKAQGNEDDDIYYDLLVIADGLRSACIPAPLLKKPEVFRSICSAEIPKNSHYRKGIVVPEDSLKGELEKVREAILKIAPNAQELVQKYLLAPNQNYRLYRDDVEYYAPPGKGDCQVCPYLARGHNRGAIHCTVHPAGYPNQNCCPDWEIDLGLEEAQNFQARKQGERQHQVIAKAIPSGEKIVIWKGNKDFHSLDWDSGDWTLQHLSDENGDYINEYELDLSKGDPQWAWHAIFSKLICREKGVDRYLIYKGCDASNWYQVWGLENPNAVPQPVKKIAEQSPYSFRSTIKIKYGESVERKKNLAIDYDWSHDYFSFESIRPYIVEQLHDRLPYSDNSFWGASPQFLTFKDGIWDIVRGNRFATPEYQAELDRNEVLEKYYAASYDLLRESVSTHKDKINELVLSVCKTILANGWDETDSPCWRTWEWCKKLSLKKMITNIGNLTIAYANKNTIEVHLKEENSIKILIPLWEQVEQGEKGLSLEKKRDFYQKIGLKTPSFSVA